MSETLSLESITPQFSCVTIPSDSKRQSLDHHDFEFRWQQAYEDIVAAAKIVMVDDEELNLEIIQSYLESEGYRNFFRTTDSTQALSLIDRVQPDVVLLDVMMPEINGLEILSMLRLDDSLRQVPVIILTACTNADTKLKALKLGPSDFLAKPVDSSELLLRIKNVLTVKAYQDHLASYSQHLEDQIARRTNELARSRQQIIHCLARAAEFRDDETGNHVARVGQYAGVIACELGFSPKDVELIEQAAQLHDIGKIGVSDSVLLKEGKLDPVEFERIKYHCGVGRSIIQPLSQTQFLAYQDHTHVGAQLLDDSNFPVMKLAATIAQTHHEKWDGSGYPLGLAGEDIPVEGRITAVADVFDALSSKRPYKPAFPREKCFKILEEGRGTHFDPRVLDAFFARSDDIVQTQIQFAEFDFSP